jgi:hypothetical protein
VKRDRGHATSLRRAIYITAATIGDSQRTASSAIPRPSKPPRGIFGVGRLHTGRDARVHTPADNELILIKLPPRSTDPLFFWITASTPDQQSSFHVTGETVHEIFEPQQHPRCCR